MSALEALYPSQHSALAQASSTSGGAASEDDVRLLARTIFAEAGSNYRDDHAMAGIGWTVRNRVGERQFGRTLEEVILRPGQFAVNTPQWRKAGDPASLTGPDAHAYAEALRTARGVLAGEIADPTNGARFFFSGKPGEEPPEGFFRKGLADFRLERSTPERLGDFTFVKERGR